MSQLFAGSNLHISNITKGETTIQGWYKGSELLWPSVNSVTFVETGTSYISDIASNSAGVWVTSDILQKVAYTTDLNTWRYSEFLGRGNMKLAAGSDSVYMYYSPGNATPILRRYLNSQINVVGAVGTSVTTNFSDSGAWSQFPYIGDSYNNIVSIPQNNGSILGDKYYYGYFSGSNFTVMKTTLTAEVKNTVGIGGTTVIGSTLVAPSGSYRSYYNTSIKKLAYATTGNLLGKLLTITSMGSAAVVYNYKATLDEGYTSHFLPAIFDNIMYSEKHNCFIGYGSSGIFYSTTIDSKASWVKVSNIGTKKLIYSEVLDTYVGISSNTRLIIGTSIV